MIVHIDDAAMAACESFVAAYWAKEQQNSNPFGDNDFERRRLNIISGKMGEFAARQVLGPDTSEPDMTMWSRGTFNPAPDLSGQGLRYHVKTKLTFSGNYTWIAHCDDPAVFRPTPTDIFVFTVADVPTRKVDVRWIVPADLIKPKWIAPESQTMANRGKVAMWECNLRWPKFEGFALPD